MKKLLLYFIIVIIAVSCNTKPKVLENGMLSKLKGEWINTTFTDSIFKYKKILPWKDDFYGNLFLSINDNDTLAWGGVQDISNLPFFVKDSVTLIAETNFGKLTFKYTQKNDIINFGKTAFKRMSEKYKRYTFKEEDQLMTLIIEKIFTEEYLPKEKNSKIKYISLGLETYTPFTFDAIGIEDDKNKLTYFGWEFQNDTLKLYKTHSSFDENSGFIFYKKGEVQEIYKKK